MYMAIKILPICGVYTQKNLYKKSHKKYKKKYKNTKAKGEGQHKFYLFMLIK